MQLNAAYNAYNNNNISIENKEKLILMLYEGILKFVVRAKQAMQENKLQDKILFINKVSAIFVELSNSLDFSQGDIAYYLQGLYNRELTRLLEANIKNDPQLLDEVIRVTRGLIEAWNDTTKDKNVD